MSKVVDDLIVKYQAPNADENTTIAKAQQWGAYMAKVGMPYDSIVAQQTGGMPAETITVDKLLAKGVPADTPLLMVGQNTSLSPDGPDGDPLVIGETIALERLRVRDLSGSAAYVALYAQRHRGATMEQALGAASQLPAMQEAVPSILQTLLDGAGL